MTYISVNHMAQALHLAFDVDIIASLYDKPTLVIDTSFGSTVGVVGHAPLYEADSRSHVELLQPHIASVVEESGLKPADIQRVVVGTGPAPFTGLRAGIVAARAFALATGAQLVGMNVLEAQSTWNRLEIANMGQYYTDSAYPNSAYPNSTAAQTYHFTLAVNDARRKQLYYALYGQGGEEILAMNIASATDIAQGVREVLGKFGFVQGDSARSVDTAGLTALELIVQAVSVVVLVVWLGLAVLMWSILLVTVQRATRALGQIYLWAKCGKSQFFMTRELQDWLFSRPVH